MLNPTSNNLGKYETVVILKDGSTLHVRPIRPDDEERLHGLFHRMSPRSIYLRFHQVLINLPGEEARRFSNVDYDSTFALVATLGEGAEEKIIAVARYARFPGGDVAELAVAVEDAYQGRGIGTSLLEQLASIAREKGIGRFEAEVLEGNEQMMKVMKDSGFRLDRKVDSGVYRVMMNIAPTPAGEEKSAEREKVATIASLKSFFAPRSIAVIGASRKEGSIGNILFRNLLLQGFNGIAYPVNPNAEMVASVKAYPSVLDIMGEVDLAVIIVPAEGVHQVLEQCGRKGVRGVVVISAGFEESGPEGKEMERKLLETARAYGMRLVGPNCMGLINTAKNVSMNATFSLVFPPAGGVAFGTQSGALGLAILEYAQSLNLGLSTFVSLGNRADVSNNDLLQYWQEDPATRVILLYLESFGNPRQFAHIARSVAETKPIIVVKSGRTSAGSRAAASHTGALATTEVLAGALFRQAGLIRVETLEELFDTANLFAHQPIPSGRRLAIITNGGGPGIMTADACAARGIELPVLSEKTMLELQTFLPPRANITNPIDMTAEATAEQYRKALRLMAEDDGIDIVVAIFIPPTVTQTEAVAGAIREVAPQFRQRGKPLLASFMGSRGASVQLGSTEEGYVPSFAFPEDTASALAAACDYGEWLRRPKGIFPELAGIDKKRAGQIVDAALKQAQARPFWLDADSVNELLACYGVRVVESKTARTAEETMKAAEAMGFPVAVKLVSKAIIHKTDVGGVVLDVRSEQEAREAFLQIRERLTGISKEAEMDGVLVQKMVTEGVEVIVGVTQDPSFGPLIMFGMGGIYTELFKDAVFRIHPLTDVDAREMVRSIKAYQILEGWRGAKPSDIKALEELLLRISAMVEDFPQIMEMDLNPLKALEHGYAVVDAKIRLT